MPSPGTSLAAGAAASAEAVCETAHKTLVSAERHGREAGKPRARHVATISRVQLWPSLAGRRGGNDNCGCEAQQAGPVGQEAPVSHTAVDSEVLFWFVIALTALLGMLISVVVRTPHGTVGSPQPPGPSPPVDSAVRPARAGYRPRHAGGMRPELMVAGRRQVSAGPPWGPAPWPPDLADRDTVPWFEVPGLVPGTASAYREISPRPAHRRAPRHGAHRVSTSTGQERTSVGGTGRHRAGVH
jgi:hypothetical protein